MPPPRAIVLIFDLDDTLIDSRIDFVAVRHQLIELLEHAGAAAGPREYLLARSLPELAALGEGVSAELARRMWEIIGAAEREGLRQATAVAHAPAVLAALRARGYRLAVLTNRPHDNLRPRLRDLRLDGFFDVVATRNEVPALKPSPEGIRYVLAQIRGGTRAYLIGDAWIDARAAADAGIPFIGFGPKRPSVDERGLPVWQWISDLRELLELNFTRDA